MREQRKVHIGFPLIFFVLGMLYLFILPPFTAPDEAGHFATAYHYANVLCGGEDPAVESTAGNVCRQIAMREQDAVLYGHLAAQGGYAVLADFAREMPVFPIENVSQTPCLCRTMPYIFLLYIPAVTAIQLCRCMGLGSVIMVYLTRFLTFMTAWYIVCRAIDRTPAGKNVFQAIVLFPMALHLFASCSADALANAAAFYGSAMILYYRQNSVKLQAMDGMALVVALTVVTLSKPFYILFFALGFLMRSETFDKKWHHCMFCMIPLLCWIWKYFPIVFSCFLDGDVSAYADVSKGYSVGYILAHPVEIARLIVHSIWKELPYIGAQSIGLYLGPLTIRIPSAAVAVFAVLLLWAVFFDGAEQTVLRGKSRIAVIVLFALTYVCCYGMDLLWWTPFGADTIEGVQGRYLLPLLGMLCVALKPAKTVQWRRLENKNCAVPAAVTLVHMYVLVSVFWELK